MGCGVVTKRIEELGGITEGVNVMEDVSDNFISNGVHIKVTPIPAGLQVFQHKHKYPHVALLMKGKVWVESDNHRYQMIPGMSTTIAAGVYHAVTAIEDSVWMCIHDKADEVN